MVKISLKKILSKKEGLAVINNIIKAIDAAIVIQDTNGNILIGSKSKNQLHKYQVELGGEIIGWVMGEEKALAVASLLSYLAQKELEKKTLANEVLEKYREITLLYETSQEITASLELKEVAKLVINEAIKPIGASNGWVFLLNEETKKIELLSDLNQSENLKVEIKLGEGIVGSVVQTGRGEIVNDVSSDPILVETQEQISSSICVPLKTKDKVIGAIAIGSETPVTYTSEDLKLLTMLAVQAGSAIENALLYEQSRIAAAVAQAQAQQLQQTLQELKQAQSQLIQSEKMSSLGQMVAGVAHEINNPVNFIHGNLSHAHEYARELLDLVELYSLHYPKPAPEIAARIEEGELDFIVEDLPKLMSSMQMGVDRIRQIVSSLRNFSHLDRAEMKPADIHEGIESTLLILHHRLKATGESPGIQIVKEYGKLPLVECYPGQLNQVFMNVIGNAIDALEESYGAEKLCHKPTIWIQTEAVDRDTIAIRIRDNGLGMTEQVRKKLFDPFFTTKPIGKGTGLGLSISYQIVVEKHQGSLNCCSEPGRGTEFCIQIPVAPQGVPALPSFVPVR